MMKHSAKITAPVVDKHLPTPLYHQVYSILRNKILSGELPHGAMLPGELEIVRQFGVSRITAKRALNDLAALGLVARERGRGTRVTLHERSPLVHGNAEGLFENLLAMGLDTEVSVLTFDYRPAGDEVAGLLECAATDIVQHIIRIRSLGGAPLDYLTTHVPQDIGRRYSERDLTSETLLATLERFGAVATTAEQTISATLAGATVAPALGVEFGSPLLSVERVARDRDGRAIEHIHALYRPDVYQFRMKLTRGDDGEKTWFPIVKCDSKDADC